MIAQVDEDQLAVIAAAVDPAGQADRFTDMIDAEIVTGMAAIAMHGCSIFSEFRARHLLACERAARKEKMHENRLEGAYTTSKVTLLESE